MRCEGLVATTLGHFEGTSTISLSAFRFVPLAAEVAGCALVPGSWPDVEGSWDCDWAGSGEVVKDEMDSEGSRRDCGRGYLVRRWRAWVEQSLSSRGRPELLGAEIGPYQKLRGN